jgi:hypothetical protein
MKQSPEFSMSTAGEYAPLAAPRRKHAYLAQISSGDQSGVALCLKTDHGPDPNLVREIGAIFADIFGGHEHLDILFLNETQESALRRVCAPFYVGSTPAD